MAQDDNSNRDDVDRVLEIRKASIGEAEVHEEPRAALEDGQIRLRIDRFAVTANNISYAGAGDLLGYWDFFPSPGAPEWGRVPAVGYGALTRLVASQPLINFVVTNVPGPSERLFFLGGRIDPGRILGGNLQWRRRLHAIPPSHLL